MKKNECIFSFGKINKYYLFPFLCPIFCFLANFFFDLYVEIPNKNLTDKKIKKKLYFLSSIYPLSYFGGGLLYFITYIRTKTETSKKSRVSSSSIEYIYNEPIRQNNTLKILSILFIISLLYNISIICNLLSYKKTVLERRLYYFLLLPIFSKIILKSELYSHQILSLCISIIGMILLFIPKYYGFEKSYIIFNILVFFSTSISSFNFVMAKFLTHKYFLSPYFILLYVGFFSLIIFLLGFISYYLLNNFDEFKKNFINENSISVVYIILSIIFLLILDVLSYLVIYFFHPTLLMLTDIINPIIKWIKSLITGEEEKTTLNIILNSVGFSLALFSALIYNEIIILNFFGLNSKTKKYLEEKQREELSIMDNDNDFDD